jgi:hypothetical protein
MRVSTPFRGQNSALFGRKEEISARQRATPIPLMEFKSGGSIVASSDPTDHALAAIASIRDNAEDDAALQPQSEAEKQAIAVIEDKPLAPEQPDPDCYFKVGPGPMTSIRFKWSVRRGDDDNYFVDETIGENSAAVTSGPMSREAAIQMVDDREADARRRFEDLRNEMAGRGAIANVLRDDGDA